MKTLFEIYLRILGYNIDNAITELNYVYSLSPKEFLDWQNKQRWLVAQYHYKNNASYQKKINNDFPSKWESLPIMEKSDYQEDLELMLSHSYNSKNVYIANTSGSSGHPFFFAKNKKCHARTWAFWKKRYEELGLTFSSKEARFFGTKNDLIGNFKDRLKDILMNRYCFNVFDLSDEALIVFINKFKSIRFDYVYGYAQTILIFSRFLVKNKIILKEICPSIKVVIITAEVCSLEDKKIIEKGIGVPVKDEYGASEVGYLAKECDLGNWHIIDENVYIETGKDGKLLVTDLFNFAEPFIRYSIGDLGEIYNFEKCQCGDFRRVLSKLKGRDNDIINLPNGKIAPGLTFYYISRSILESSGGLNEFIIRQISLDTFVFDIISKEKLNDNQIKRIQYEMDSYLTPGLKLIINNVNKLKRPKSGKIKHFYSEIN